MINKYLKKTSDNFTKALMFTVEKCANLSKVWNRRKPWVLNVYYIRLNKGEGFGSRDRKGENKGKEW